MDWAKTVYILKQSLPNPLFPKSSQRCQFPCTIRPSKMKFLGAILIIQLVFACVLAQRVQEWGVTHPNSFLLNQQRVRVVQTNPSGSAIIRRTVSYPAWVSVSDFYCLSAISQLLCVFHSRPRMNLYRSDTFASLMWPTVSSLRPNCDLEDPVRNMSASIWFHRLDVTLIPSSKFIIEKCHNKVKSYDLATEGAAWSKHVLCFSFISINTTHKYLCLHTCETKIGHFLLLIFSQMVFNWFATSWPDASPINVEVAIDSLKRWHWMLGVRVSDGGNVWVEWFAFWDR